ncbi:hypothetical protein C7212DRAFT_366950 [Tuber magnatum]|uniref:NACHT domain-containing protein n=1 Tax=Tuber magnatum TaxID=42249 RepID=A0A317SBS3_9PEZI|nr:hypothetical protein C7212DRAFT_366950 [Tuber magnatum]
MGNLLSNTPGEDHSSQQGVSSSGSARVAHSYIEGSYSGNINSNNTTNIHHNYGSTSSPESCAEILQQLYTSAYESHRRRVREPVEGTCIWVTEHPKYRDWLRIKRSGLLWLSADPGCGKSVIASFLITHLKTQSDAIVCYFFFKDDSDEQRSATFALCAILHQLFSQRNSLCRYAERAFKEKGKRFTEEVDTLWDILIEAVAEGVCGDVICMVDALDECEEVTLAPFIRHVNRLPGSQHSNIPLKFIVTSRPYHKIERELGARATTIRLKGEDAVDATTADVTRVIDDGIKELEVVWENPGGLEYLRNLLKSSADRTFLWVSLVLEILKDSEDDSQVEFTNIVSASPPDLAEFYTKILDKSAKPVKAQRILHIVVGAARPLTLVEMNTALTITQDHRSMRDIQRGLYRSPEKTIKSLCGLFVRIIDSKVYLVHQTAREFLIKGMLPGRGRWQYTLHAVDSNFILADICTAYLALQDFENDPLAMDALGNPGSASRKAVDNYAQKYALIDYAATHWAGHFRDSEDRQMELLEAT